MGRILLIDDEPSTRLLYRSRLEDIGHEVTLASTGAEGLSEARNGNFDLFLCDVGLGSGVDGFEVCRRLKAIPRTHGVPVVLMSGQRTTREDLHTGYAAGCEAFLVKGDMTLLEDVLRAMLRIKGLKDDIAVQNVLLERQNRRLQEEVRTRAGSAGDVPRGEGRGVRRPERPLALVLVSSDGNVQSADRGARELFGPGIEGRSLGVLAPSRGLEAFVRDVRTEGSEGFPFDLPSRAGRPARSLVASVVPIVPRGDADLGGLKILSIFDASEAHDLRVPSVDPVGDCAIADAARRTYRVQALLGGSLAAISLREALERAASSTQPALVLGEEGAGKTFAARCLHYAGGRGGRMVVFDAEARPAAVHEAELFGAPGAEAEGLLERAEGGTLLISGIAALSAQAQARLGAAVEHGSGPLAGAAGSGAARVVAESGQTREELEDAASAGRFDPRLLRSFDRHVIRIAPLRERREDVRWYARAFLQAVTFGAVTLNEDAIGVLEDYDWPGNLRQLEGAVRVLAAAALGDSSSLHTLPHPVREQAAELLAASGGTGRRELVPVAPPGGSASPPEVVSFDGYERLALLRALEETEGDKLAAAALLGVGKSTLYRKLKHHGIT